VENFTLTGNPTDGGNGATENPLSTSIGLKSNGTFKGGGLGSRMLGVSSCSDEESPLSEFITF
jgi:hypothetical protein